ncbi:MAG: dynamin family protein [Chitinivibrionales bacterium]|nr:dynamin family protein [Chitinivibrionales bacterium]
MPEKEAIFIDEVMDRALEFCRGLPADLMEYRKLFEECRTRLTKGQLHLAVLGQFNRGKSTFINALLGENILPTSVLPLTTVPTIIKYGPADSCSIRFVNNKEEMVARESLKEIQTLLRNYVTEEYNHRNKHNVREAVVTCPCDLLLSGTIIIDTPGFGSTHLHNTQTTRDLLTDCDAVLFVLSADLPITQAEIEFLREACPHIPHFVFVLNKIDLLSAADLQKTDSFIRSVLQKNFPQLPAVELIGVSARTATLAKTHHDDDVYWAESRMGAVVRIIGDFLAREKYFVLSQALTDKFKEAFDSIIGRLSQKRKTLSAPAEAFAAQENRLKEVVAQVKRKGEKEGGLVALEKKALREFLSSMIEQKKTGLLEQLNEALSVILEGALKYADPARTIKSSVPPLLGEILKLSLVQIVALVNRPFKRAAAAHVREYAKLYGEIQGLWPEAFPMSLTETISELEITADQEVPGADTILPSIKMPLFQRFWSKRKRLAYIHERSLEGIRAIIDTQSRSLAIHCNNLLDGAADKLIGSLQQHYGKLAVQLQEFMAQTEERRSLVQHEVQPESEKLNLLQTQFSDLRKQLV